MTSKTVLENVMTDHATLLNDRTTLCESDTRDTSPMDELARKAGYSGIKQVGNDWNVWSSEVREVARTLCECIARQNAEEARVGEWDDVDQFLADAK